MQIALVIGSTISTIKDESVRRRKLLIVPKADTAGNMTGEPFVAIVSSVILAITGFFRPNEKVFYLTVAMIIIMPMIWYTFGRNRFEGVPEGEKVTQRQKLIAEIEKKYGEGD